MKIYILLNIEIKFLSGHGYNIDYKKEDIFKYQDEKFKKVIEEDYFFIDSKGFRIFKIMEILEDLECLFKKRKMDKLFQMVLYILNENKVWRFLYFLIIFNRLN